MAQPHEIGPVSDFPIGSHRVIKVRNVELGIFNVDGTLHALSNICPHQFGPACHGTVNGTPICNEATGWTHQWGRDGEILTCPWHGVEFDIVTGVALATPRWQLRRYPVLVENNLVSILL